MERKDIFFPLQKRVSFLNFRHYTGSVFFIDGDKMFIELAHYTLLFATAVLGLQTALLMPTLWSKGAAVAIKLGFRGLVFGVCLLLASLAVLAAGYAARDFSVAIVFENFSSQTPLNLLFPAILAAREGYFFVFLAVLGLCALMNFSKTDLPTYQERGRYLFACGGILFLMTVLMIMTANPFIRIENPPLEGLGLKGDALNAPYTLKRVFLFFAFGVLTTGWVKAVCMASKARPFVAPQIRSTQTALMLMLAASGLEFINRLVSTDRSGFFGWLPAASLETAALVLAAGQLLMLYFAKLSTVFSRWIVAFGVALTFFLGADFFAAEYRLFALNTFDVYFPNPVTAVCGLFGLTSFLLFFMAALSGKAEKDAPFSLFSRESFVGLAAASCLSAGLSIGLIALLPALFMFVPDLPLRLLPDLLRRVFVVHLFLFAVFAGIAFLRKSVQKGWTLPSAKGFAAFWGTIGVFTLCLPPEKRAAVLYCLPALILLRTVLKLFRFRKIGGFAEMAQAVKKTPLFYYGLTLCAVGFLILSAAFSTSLLFARESESSAVVQNEINLENVVLRTEKLAEKTEDAPADRRFYAFAKKGRAHALNNADKVPMTVLHSDFPTVSLIRIDLDDESLKIKTMTYPGIRLIWDGLLLMIVGLGIMTWCWKRER